MRSLAASARHPITLLLALGTAFVALSTHPARALGARIEVVADGLDNPRGLAFGPYGALLVAEAGRGGDGPCYDGPEGELCFGNSGAVTLVLNGQQTRLVSGLPSVASPDGSHALGPVDVSVYMPGWVDVVIGLGADPSLRDDLGEETALLGHLVRLAAYGWLDVADVAGYELEANPDEGEIDSNPYALVSHGTYRLVVDAGANALLNVSRSDIQTVAVFPERLVDAPPELGLPPDTQIPMQAVPNSITVGPDGAYYVGELTGYPFPVGAARVYRVVPGAPPEVYAQGFTNIIDLAFGADGSLYVLEIATHGLLSGDLTGALVKVTPEGDTYTIACPALVAPTGLAIGPDQSIYISNYGIFPGEGEVLRIRR